jgi:diguanylate cyclase (GGDEF)-like protein/PAS domain S-box-containing protein
VAGTNTHISNETKRAPGSRFGAILDRLPSGLGILDQNLNIIFTNTQFNRIVGDQQLANTPFSALFAEDDRGLLEMRLQTLLLDPETSHSLDLRLLSGDGAVHWVLALFSATKSDSRPLDIEIFVEITPIDIRKQRERELIEREGRWDQALMSSGLGVWDHNLETGIFYYSDIWKSLRGLNPEDEVQAAMDDWIEKVHPDDRTLVLEEIARQEAGDGNFSTFRYRERHKDGHWVWIECRGACVAWNSEGRAIRVIGTDMDVTDRMAAEERMTRMSRRLALALEVSRVGVFEADLSKTVTEWDDRMLAIYGITDGKHERPVEEWKTLLHPEDSKRADEHVIENIKNKTSFTNDFRIIRHGNEIRYIRARVAAFPNGSNTYSIVGANWDVTEDVLLQHELERAKTLAEARNHELEATRAEVEHNSLHDYLTGLPNRRYLDLKLDDLVPYCQQHRHPLAIFHIDLDRFKQINDTLGHLAGDAMLKHAAHILVESSREEDFVARVGGDEFVVLVTSCHTRRDLEAYAERITCRFRQPVPYEGHFCRMGASIGISVACRQDLDGKQMLLNADIALYHAKKRGRNRHEFFSPDLQKAIINTRTVSDAILSGIDNHEFVPFYQLQFHAKTLEIAGVETLARWNHPTEGIRSPDYFLSVAEDLNVVSTIDGMMLDQALKDLALWKQQHLDIPKISVNVSARRLEDPTLAAKLNNLSFEPGTVSFELLETIFLDDNDTTVKANLQAIRDRGIAIEIDDFGTGHASIVSLLKIAPHTLKIDRELIKPVPYSAEQRRLVRSIIEIGKSLNITVLAEGVETREHIKILQDLGCDILQGYALAKPLCGARIPEFVRLGDWRI